MKYYKIKLFSIYLLSMYVTEDGGWIRFFGKGFNWKHKDCGLTFSQRNGYSKYFKVGNYIVSYLD